MQSKRLRIGIDVDDVVADFVGAHRKVCQGLFGKPKDEVLPVDWEFSNYGLTPAQHKEVWHKIQHTKDFWLGLEPLPETGLLPLYQRDLQYFFITARVPSVGYPVETQTALWLMARMNILTPTVIVKARRKGELVKALELHAFIDDKPENCVDVVKRSPDTQVFIRERSHNLDFRHAGVIRLQTLDEFLRRF